MIQTILFPKTMGCVAALVITPIMSPALPSLPCSYDKHVTWAPQISCIHESSEENCSRKEEPCGNQTTG
jgi:hypothetical protein